MSNKKKRWNNKGNQESMYERVDWFLSFRTLEYRMEHGEITTDEYMDKYINMLEDFKDENHIFEFFHSETEIKYLLYKYLENTYNLTEELKKGVDIKSIINQISAVEKEELLSRYENKASRKKLEFFLSNPEKLLEPIDPSRSGEIAATYYRKLDNFLLLLLKNTIVKRIKVINGLSSKVDITDEAIESLFRKARKYPDEISISDTYNLVNIFKSPQKKYDVNRLDTGFDRPALTPEEEKYMLKRSAVHIVQSYNKNLQEIKETKLEKRS